LGPRVIARRLKRTDGAAGRGFSNSVLGDFSRFEAFGF